MRSRFCGLGMPHSIWGNEVRGRSARRASALFFQKTVARRKVPCFCRRELSWKNPKRLCLSLLVSGRFGNAIAGPAYQWDEILFRTAPDGLRSLVRGPDHSFYEPGDGSNLWTGSFRTHRLAG